jgi:hypothetical protein
MTKTEHYLKLLLAINESSSGKVSEQWLKDFFNHPPKATWHRYIKDLTQGFGEIPAVLVKFTSEGANFYRINSSRWANVTEGDEESFYIWEALNKVGYLYSPLVGKTNLLDEDSKSKLKNFDRKFVYLGQSKPRDAEALNEKLPTLIQSVLDQNEVIIEYDQELKQVRPIALIQYKDDLYLGSFRKNEKGSWEKRIYKVTRITKIEIQDKKFPYPDKMEWNPKEELEKQSGLVQGKKKFVQIEVYGVSRKTFQEKIIFGSQFIEKRIECDIYQLQFSNEEELLSLILGYIQDIRVINAPDLMRLIDKKVKSFFDKHPDFFKVA